MRKNAGFTLIELIVTLAVAGILASLAVPSFKTTIQNNRLVTQSNDLLGAMLYARSQAISGVANGTTNPPRYVTVCASSDGATCSSTNWANGWIVSGYPTAPTAAPGVATNLSVPSTTATVMRAYPAITGNNTINSSVLGSSINFKSDGTTDVTATNPYFFVCDSRGVSYGRAVYVSGSGEARVSPTAGKELNGTTAVTCP